MTRDDLIAAGFVSPATQPDALPQEAPATPQPDPSNTPMKPAGSFVDVLHKMIPLRRYWERLLFGR